VFLLSIATFYISVSSPIDPIATKYTKTSVEAGIVTVDEFSIIKEKQNLGLFLPAFYFRLVPAGFNKNYYQLITNETRELYEKAIFKGLDGTLVLDYLLEFEAWNFKEENWGNAVVSESMIEFSFFENLEKHPAFWKSLENKVEGAAEFQIHLNSIIKKGQTIKRFFPKIIFFKNNQYHNWFFGGSYSRGLIRGDFGKSYSNGKSVWVRIKKALPWTFVLSLITIVLSIVSSVFLGLVLGYFNNNWWSKGIKSFLFLLYTMPAFWLATLLLMFFANPDYFNWFPPGGIKPIYSVVEPDFWQLFTQSLSYMVLPIIALSYSSITMLSRYVQSSTAEAMQSLYVFSARTRGLTEKRVLFKHVLPNVLLPLVTLIGAAIPGLFSGAVVIEAIFSIPGMGQELLNATLNNDVNLVVGILTISGALTILGYLISDALYAIVDPRIKLEQL
jgi:peptide/nickel transport system permease protein